MTTSKPDIDLKENLLFADFQRGHLALFDYFFDKYYQGLCVYASRLLKSTTDAEDLVEEFFVRILENRKNIHIECSIKSYFLRSVHNRCLDYLAHQKVRTFHDQYRLKRMQFEDCEDYPLLDSELEQKLNDAIQQLPDGIRQTFLMNRFEGLKYQQIAEIEQVSVKTIEYRISKALSILRLKLADYLQLFVMISLWG